jgi:ubiquinone/menaquinone biosynthesis C-methylase UbiE
MSYLNAMDNEIKPTILEWNAQEYDQGNTIQYNAALYFLTHNNIETKNKRILDVACGTGEVSAFLAEKCHSVHGFDASKNMIDWAKKHHAPHYKNISFHQCCVEDFSSDRKYDLATLFFCFHWFTDKEKALKRVSASLKENGEIFGTFSTTDIQQNPGHAILKKMMTEWNLHSPLNQALARSAITTQELKTMLANAGFEIIKCDLQENNMHFAGRSDIEKFNRPIIMSRPFIKALPTEQQEQFLQEFIDKIIPIFKKSDDGQFTHLIQMTIVHARKKTE